MDEPFPTSAHTLEARAHGRANEIVEGVLRCLVGEALRAVTRATDMIVLGFGEDVLPTAIVYKGADPERAADTERRNQTPIARIRLHVQCPFRLDSSSGPFVGGHDVYNGAEPPHGRLDDDSWDPIGSSASRSSVMGVGIFFVRSCIHHGTRAGFRSEDSLTGSSHRRLGIALSQDTVPNHEVSRLLGRHSHARPSDHAPRLGPDSDEVVLERRRDPCVPRPCRPGLGSDEVDREDLESDIPQ